MLRGCVKCIAGEGRCYLCIKCVWVHDESRENFIKCNPSGAQTGIFSGGTRTIPRSVMSWLLAPVIANYGTVKLICFGYSCGRVLYTPSRLITQKEHHCYVKTVSFWRNYVKITSFWRYNDVIITSYVRRVCITPVLTRATRTAVSWEYPRLSHDDPYCRFILDPFNSKSIGPPTTLSRLPRGHTENEMFAVNTVEVTERTRICLQIDRQTDKVLHIHMIPTAY